TKRNRDFPTFYQLKTSSPCCIYLVNEVYFIKTSLQALSAISADNIQRRHTLAVRRATETFGTGLTRLLYFLTRNTKLVDNIQLLKNTAQSTTLYSNRIQIIT